MTGVFSPDSPPSARPPKLFSVSSVGYGNFDDACGLAQRFIAAVDVGEAVERDVGTQRLKDKTLRLKGVNQAPRSDDARQRERVSSDICAVRRRASRAAPPGETDRPRRPRIRRSARWSGRRTCRAGCKAPGRRAASARRLKPLVATVYSVKSFRCTSGNSCRIAAVICSMTPVQSPRSFCRNRRIVGYQAVRSPPASQRQSGTLHSATHTGTPRAPATPARSPCRR